MSPLYARAAAAAAVRACTLEHKLIPSPSFRVSGRREGGGRSVRTLHQIESVSPHVVAAAHCIASLFFSFHFLEKKKAQGTGRSDTENKPPQKKEPCLAHCGSFPDTFRYKIINKKVTRLAGPREGNSTISLHIISSIQGSNSCQQLPLVSSEGKTCCPLSFLPTGLLLRARSQQ